MDKKTKKTVKKSKPSVKKAPAKKRKFKLPSKPSDLIDLAVDDLERVEKDKRFVVDMGTYNSHEAGKCHVCFAGSVMAKSLELVSEKDVDDVLHGKVGDAVVYRKILALDYFRRGQVVTALDRLGLSRFDVAAFGLRDFKAPIYKYYPLAFKCEMRGLAARLRYAGM